MEEDHLTDAGRPDLIQSLRHRTEVRVADRTARMPAELQMHAVRRVGHRNGLTFQIGQGERIDPVPGELDATKDGLPRVYDKDLTAATYFS